MNGYGFTPQAVDDLFEIWRHIAEENLDAANRVEGAIYSACTFLTGTPLAGRIREDLTTLPLRLAGAAVPELLDRLRCRDQTVASDPCPARRAEHCVIVGLRSRKRSRPSPCAKNLDLFFTICFQCRKGRMGTG